MYICVQLGWLYQRLLTFAVLTNFICFLMNSFFILRCFCLLGRREYPVPYLFFLHAANENHEFACCQCNEFHCHVPWSFCKKLRYIHLYSCLDLVCVIGGIGIHRETIRVLSIVLGRKRWEMDREHYHQSL